MEEILRRLNLRPEEVFFWAVHQQAKIDLLTFQQGQAIGYEIKYSESPKLSKSMLAAKAALNLEKLYVVYPGTIPFPLADGIEVVPMNKISPN